MQTFLSLLLFIESSMLQMSKILVGLSIASVVAFANPTNELGGQGISKTDSEFLFENNSANVVALSSDEMKATEGERLPIMYYLGAYAVSYANAPTLRGRTYYGRPNKATNGYRG